MAHAKKPATKKPSRQQKPHGFADCPLLTGKGGCRSKAHVQAMAREDARHANYAKMMEKAPLCLTISQADAQRLHLGLSALAGLPRSFA